ncbi:MULTISPECIES: hypothetical protein [unclassified Synechocystis]|uniref:hypothetical protein n=1 Tax=unclassified Synechocystis TaxID=2640012 RepID=UPI00040F30B4|nr:MULTISPECIES: hypothetical protein [unclassified Synechocystis]AIE73915.1 hypothetical protein D082_13870 [Synechocystis sp. PCC 6714]MCT0252486.1 hypothetical protein [Synechocystis sp. CS-94]
MNPPQTSGHKKLGLVLQEAGLITPAQLEVALNNQHHFGYLIGEVIVLHGWLTKDTIEFFVNQWFDLIYRPNPMPLGHYLQMADLLNQCQIDEILREQKRLGLRFGATAVLRGWLKQETVDYFIAHLKVDMVSQSAFNTHGTGRGKESRIGQTKTSKTEPLRPKDNRPTKKSVKAREEKKNRRSKVGRHKSALELSGEVSGALPENFDIFIADDENFDLASVLETDDGNISF